MDLGLKTAVTIARQKRSFVKRDIKIPISGAKIISDDAPPRKEPKRSLPGEGESFISLPAAKRRRKVIIVLRKIRTSI